MFAEMMGLVKSARPLLEKVQRPAKTKRSGPQQLTRLKAALKSDDPLPKIVEIIPNDGRGERATVVDAYGCLLETNSGGLSMIFDRFGGDEFEQMMDAVERIGAARTLRDLKALRRVWKRAATAGEDQFEAADAVARYAKTNKIDAARATHVRELERQLVKFCKAHVEDLAR
ncbi:MAG TPA: hypothetical protein VJ691_00355 [Vicinamibacterales bacterium]|nr:hypothetical protein [Vicinamibacterales bacterium]